MIISQDIELVGEQQSKNYTQEDEMEKTPDMDDMIDDLVKELSESDEPSVVSEYFQFIGHFEDITTKELVHEHVQVVVKDIAGLQNAKDLPDKLKKAFPEKADIKDEFKGLVDSVKSLSFEEIQFANPEKEEAIICLLALLSDDYRKQQKGEVALIKRSGINNLLRCIQLIALTEDLYQKGLPPGINQFEDIDLLKNVRLLGFIEGSMVARNEIFENEELKEIIHSAVSAKKVRDGRWKVADRISEFLASIAAQRWENGDKTYHNNMADYLLELFFDELVFDEKDKVPKNFGKSGLTKDEKDVLKVRQLVDDLRHKYTDRKIYDKIPSKNAMMNAIKPIAYKLGFIRGVHKKAK